MKLDFTALNSIPAHRKPAGSIQGNLAIETEQTGCIHRLEKEKRERETARQIYAQYQQNIKRTETLRGDIARAIKQGEDPLVVLLKAVECISLMTDDPLLLQQCQADILEVYGWGLGEPAPLKLELEETKARLAMMTRPEALAKMDKNTENAIREHSEKVTLLEMALAEAEHRRGEKYSPHR